MKDMIKVGALNVLKIRSAFRRLIIGRLDSVLRSEGNRRCR